MHQETDNRVQFKTTVRLGPVQIDGCAKNRNLQDHKSDQCHPKNMHSDSGNSLRASPDESRRNHTDNTRGTSLSQGEYIERRKVPAAMVVRIRVGRGRPVEHRSGKNGRAARLAASLLTLIAICVASFGVWRVAQDLGWAGDFVIAEGLFSHWQVWIGARLLPQLAASRAL